MNEWMNNPQMLNLDPIKLELIKTAAAQTLGKSGNSLATVMMALITSANKKGIQFTPDEVSLILEILKEGKSPQEQKQIDKVVPKGEEGPKTLLPFAFYALLFFVSRSPIPAVLLLSPESAEVPESDCHWHPMQRL